MEPSVTIVYDSSTLIKFNEQKRYEHDGRYRFLTLFFDLDEENFVFEGETYINRYIEELVNFLKNFDYDFTEEGIVYNDGEKKLILTKDEMEKEMLRILKKSIREYKSKGNRMEKVTVLVPNFYNPYQKHRIETLTYSLRNDYKSCTFEVYYNFQYAEFGGSLSMNYYYEETHDFDGGSLKSLNVFNNERLIFSSLIFEERSIPLEYEKIEPPRRGDLNKFKCKLRPFFYISESDSVEIGNGTTVKLFKDKSAYKTVFVYVCVSRLSFLKDYFTISQSFKIESDAVAFTINFYETGENEEYSIHEPAKAVDTGSDVKNEDVESGYEKSDKKDELTSSRSDEMISANSATITIRYLSTV